MRRMPHNTRRRHGVSALVAMMYLVLFSTMAVGFYATTNTAAQVAHNDRNIARALLAAECGMDFMRYQMAQVIVPAATRQDQLFANLATCLGNQVNGTANVGGSSIYADNNVIRIPASPSEFVKLDNDGSEFRVVVHNRGHKVLITIYGRHGDVVSMSRGVQMEFGLAEKAHEIFDYGIATKGSVATSGQAKITGAMDPTKGSILATSTTNPTPVNIQGPLVSGDISVTNPTANVTFAAATSIGGTDDDASIIANHIHKGVAEPEFPVIDTEIFRPYVTNPLTGLPNYWIAGSTLQNMVIRANTNPTFAGGATIKGVLWIEAPNVVTFRGNTVIQGVIVGPRAPIGNLSTNVVSFAGGITASGVETLPDTFGDLRKLTGSFLLTPGFAASFTGNFNTIAGTFVADKFTFSGSAQGTIKGTVINMKDNLLSVGGTSEVVIAGNGTNNFPAGVYFTQEYESLPDTYEELR
jgi:Tfp pilus assembly protein PilX